MAGAVQEAIRGQIMKTMFKIAKYNHDHAKNTQGPHPYLTGIHTPMTAETTLENLPVTGAIPPELDGSYLRIGPNPISAPNAARYHWFTGDGMVHGVRLEGGQARWYRNRWVRTSKVSAVLGEDRAPGPRGFESAVNTNVLAHAGKIWALVEAGGNPVEISGGLETVAHDNFGGTLRGAFSAHPHRDPASGELHAICYHATNMEHVYHVVVGTDGRVRREAPIAVEHGPSIHDCAITQRFVLVFDLPVTFSTTAMLSGYGFPFRWNANHKARVGLLPREGRGDEVIWCEVDPCYLYHPCNAFELADGRVVVDVVMHDQNSFQDFRGPDANVIKFERWTVDPVARKVERVVLDDTAQEFPRFDERRTGQAYRYAYALGLPGRARHSMVGETFLLKHDLVAGGREKHDFGAGHYPGEFVFVPRGENAGEDEGWLMGLVVNAAAGTTALVILDAAKFTAPPVASVLIPHNIPPGFHGNWVPAGG